MADGALMAATPFQIIDWDGKPISKPGIYRGVPNRVYHGPLTVEPSVSRSGLWKLFNKSPRHFWHESYLNPDRPPEDEAEALVLGRAAHHVLLGEGAFREHFIVRPETYPEGVEYGDPIPHSAKLKPWNGNATWCKEWLADHKDDPRGILKPDHIETIKGMAGGLSRDHMVQRGALQGLVEHTLVYRDEETGVWIKTRPDVIPTTDDDVADLKTCADISDEGLEKAIGRDGLFLQGAMTALSWRHVLGRELGAFNFVFVEKAAPYCVRTRELSRSEIELGITTFRTAVRLFAQCVANDDWPGPGTSEDLQPIQMKPYDRMKIERRLTLLERDLAA